MHSQEGIELLLLVRHLFEKTVSSECYGFHSDFCFIDLTCVKIAGNMEDYDAAVRFFDSAFEQYIMFNQWGTEKYNEWQEQIGKTDKKLNGDERFHTMLFRTTLPAQYKVIMCEPEFFERAIHSFAEEKQKLIKENPKYSCIFDR